MDSSAGGAPWRRQRSEGSGGSAPVTPPAAPPLPANGSSAGPPPPPPMAHLGSLPPVRLNSEIGPLDKGPPKQIQGAMMKDKKPFTYTPGGIDLFAEIRSPRMAKRIQMNAAAEGVTSVTAPPQSNGHQPKLPPAAIAAMQPQMPVAVFPQGNVTQTKLHHVGYKPADFAPPPPIPAGNFVPPPPPPPQQLVSLEHESRQGSAAPSPRTPPVSLASIMNQSVRGSPSVETEPKVQSHQTELLVYPPQHQTMAQAMSQQPRTIYNPQSTGDKSQAPQMNTHVVSMTKSMSNESDSDRDTVTENINSKTSTPLTPHLNKAPTPWLTSHNKTSPPTVTKQGSPWGQPVAGRSLPIGIENKSIEDEESLRNVNIEPQKIFRTYLQLKSPTDEESPHGQIAQPPSPPAASSSGGTRIIPIQIEGQSPNHQRAQQSQQASTPRQSTVYASPQGLFAGQQGANRRSDINLQEGIDKLSLDEGYRTTPVQSKSFKVLQRITDEEERADRQKLELKGEDKQLMDSVKTKVDESSLHQTTEPRFRGEHIPSRAFQALRSHLPPSQDPKLDFQAYPSKPAPVTHNIQIQVAPQSPTQTFQQNYYPTEVGQGNRGVMSSAGHHDYQLIPEHRRPTGGGGIPSRFFQNFNYDHPGSVLEGSIPPGLTNTVSNHSNCPCPSPLSHNGSDQGQVNEHINTNWDAYWYYYWYWANYWQSLGYECPPPDWEGQNGHRNSSPVTVPSRKFKKLQRVYDEDLAENGVNELDSSSINLQAGKLQPSDKTGYRNRLGSIDESEEEETVPETTESESESTYGIIEEPPGTPVSSSDDLTPIFQKCDTFVEECFSDSESEPPLSDIRTTRLSTIDELSETERGISSQSSFDPNEPIESDYLSERSGDEDTFDEDSTESVIENEGNDLTASTIDDESSSSEDQQDDFEVEVTVRLPIRNSFTRSKSYRDIATVLVGTSDETRAALAFLEDKNSDATSEKPNDSVTSTDEPVKILDATPEVDRHPEPPDDKLEEIDFWGEIIGDKSDDDLPNRCITSVKMSNSEKSCDTVNFWDLEDTGVPQFNLFEHHGQFKLSADFTQDYDRFDEHTKNLRNVETEIEQNEPVIESEIFEKKSFPYNDKDFDADLEIETDWINETKSPINLDFRLSDPNSALLSASDETSDESSSKSSTATVTHKFNRAKKFPLLLEPTRSGPEVPEDSEMKLNSFENGEALEKSVEGDKDQVEDACSCHPVTRTAKAENLLWRIERFLQQSFTSLGSEEDSGVMTDQSRQMSDADTDNDEGSLKSQPRTSSTHVTSDGPGALEQQRRALYYERAKTHSRLFQLLQEECDREDEEEASQSVDQSVKIQKPFHLPVPRVNSTKDCLPGSDSGLSVDSGSSGLLSPANREQILVDIINQFQSRQRTDSTGEPERRVSTSIFPSKIFKMLHDEFGEEFYDAFDFDEEELKDVISNNVKIFDATSTPKHCQKSTNKNKPTDTTTTATKTLQSETEKKRMKGSKREKVSMVQNPS